ncbi:MAG TPA: CYCXC family (seleno)protein [Terriglobia bacterium]|nr:CYCXC family (seleno)protein [Terriglobia bacterium]
MKSLIRILVCTTFLLVLAAFSLPGPDPTAQQSAPGARSASATPKSNQPEKPVPPYYKSAKAAEPLPATLQPSQFADRPVVVTAYTIAKKMPKVLVQQPCYCGCDKHFGHHSLLDCYTSEHTAGCGICVKETFFAWEMTRQHKTPAQIRAAIIRGDFNSVDINHPPDVAP